LRNTVDADIGAVDAVDVSGHDVTMTDQFPAEKDIKGKEQIFTRNC
jgi:hypothetical protein